jgi:glycogen debranching enzyme
MSIYSTSLPGGGHNANKVVTAFWPLWAGIVPPDRVEALAQHLKDPKSFWRHHPLPSLAADSPHFQPEGNYWLGSTWAPTNYAAIKGFDRAGRHDLAVEATLRHLQCMHETWRDTGVIWENYCSEASRRGNWSGPDYCWSSLGPIALLLEVLIGVEPDAARQALRWNPPPETEIGVRRFPLGTATVSLMQRCDGDRWVVDVETDRPVTLELVRGGVAKSHACRIGRTRLQGG